jgi:CRP-like cAMP-binding protein
MFIDSDILITWGGVAKKYKKGDYIFHEGDHPVFYHQVLEGGVKMYNISSDGKEFTQAEFEAGESFGEPPLFIDEFYPSTATANKDSVILKLSKDKLFEILEEYPEYQRKIIVLLARRIYTKTTSTREIINHTPETRILSFLNAYKKRVAKESTKMEIPYTRQEIANYTGLRVETVIRTLSKMKSSNIVQIVNRKLIY